MTTPAPRDSLKYIPKMIFIIVNKIFKIYKVWIRYKKPCAKKIKNILKSNQGM